MAEKGTTFAILEACQAEMRANKELCHFYEYARPLSKGPDGRVIDLFEEFGYPRVWDWGPIDESWITGCAIGTAVYGVPTVAHFPSMTTFYSAEFTFNQAGKFYAMHGQQFTVPTVLWFDMSRRIRWSGPQHADVGQEAAYGNMPGVKVVIPSTPYDAKGLMHAAIRDPGPVCFFVYSWVGRLKQEGVPDEPYEVPIGKAAIRTEGEDITIVGFAPASLEIANAIPTLKEAGISPEFIDPRSLKPLDIAPIIDSVRKTGKLLVVDHGHWTCGSGTQIIAEVAEAVKGAKFKRLAYPDAPVPGNEHMTRWMTPMPENIVDAAKKMV